VNLPTPWRVHRVTTRGDAMDSDTVEGVLALIDEQPDDAESHQRLGKAYSAAGRYEEARTAYERSLELDPTDPFTHFYLGNWY
jgi:Flp pilus assembly protein TadD